MKKLKLFFYLLGGITLILFLSRLVLPSEIDDVTPGIQCDFGLLEKSDVLWVIPLYENNSIAENKVWCSNILSLNKTLGLHGVKHTYQEFNSERDKVYFERGMNEFEKCFGFKPKIFKAPQLALSIENKKLVKEQKIIVRESLNQLFHKVYHCSDTGLFPNWLISIF